MRIEMRSQHEMLLTLMCQFLPMQLQWLVLCLWLILPIGNTGMSVVKAAARNHKDVPGLCIYGLVC